MNTLLIELAIAAAVVAGAFAAGHHGGYKVGHAEALAVQARWDRANAISAEAAVKAEQAARTEEQRRLAATQEVVTHAQAQTVVVAAAAGRALDSLAGLRQRAAAVAASCGAVPGNPAAAAGSAPTGAAASVSTQLLDGLGEPVGLALAYTDKLRIAAEACERWADALTKR